MRLVALALLCSPLGELAAQSPSGLARGGPPPRIEPAPPPAPLSGALPADVTFGYLRVPRDHSAPGGASLRLALAVLPSRSPHPAPDPIVFVPGGPGMSVILPWLAEAAASPRIALLREQRALIILEPRGHGLSDPPPCPGLSDARPLVEDSRLAEAILSSKLGECRRSWGAAGYTPRMLSAVQASRDIEHLRQALGAPQVNLLGASYGSRIAAEAMRQVPSAIRSAIFIGPVPPGHMHVGNEPGDAADALRTLIARCAEREACRTAFPSLAADLETLLARLRRFPITLRLPRSDRLPEGELLLDEEKVRAGIATLLRSRSLASAAPLLIHTLANRGPGSFEPLAPHLIAMLDEHDDVAFGTYLAFLCNDLGQHDELPGWLDARCRAWLGDRQDRDEPLRSAIPALVMVGEFDPRTPRAYADVMLAGLDSGHRITVPWHGHDYQHPCLSRIQRDFFATPTARPSVACLDSIAPIEFVSDVVTSRWMSTAIVRSASDPFRYGLPPILALPILLLPVIGMPVRARRHTGRGRRPSGRSATLWLASATALTLLVGLAGAAVSGARVHPIVPLLGIPGGWAWLVPVPWVLLSLAIVAAALSARVPRTREEGLLVWSAAGGVGLVLGWWIVHAVT